MRLSKFYQKYDQLCNHWLCLDLYHWFHCCLILKCQYIGLLLWQVEANVKRGNMKIGHRFIYWLLFVALFSLSACAYPDLTPIPTPTRVALFQPEDFADEPLPPIGQAVTPAPVETPVAEPPPAAEQVVTPVPVETPALVETPAVDTAPAVVDVVTPVAEETPVAETPLIIGQATIPAAEGTPVLEPTPVLTPVVTPVIAVTPVAEPTPTPQTPLIVGQATIPAPEETPVAETPVAATPAVTPLAIETPVVEPTPQPDVAPPLVAPAAARVLVEASTLRGHTVRNIERPGQTTVDNVVVDLGTRQILFATIRYGALLRLGNRHVPVPPEYLHWDPHDRRLLVTLPEGAIGNMRSFDNRWPDLAEGQWALDVEESWQALDPNLFLHPTIAPAKADTVAGERVVAADGTELGSVSELLLDLETNQIAYVVVRMRGGFLGLGREYRAVPMEIFEVQAIDPAEREITLLLDVPEPTLRAAPAYDVDLLRNGDTPWELENRRYWEMPPRHQQTAGN
jgi:sporulation protein YlmC with PRC-barrel domain